MSDVTTVETPSDVPETASDVLETPALASVEIWFKSKRVLRTIVQVVLGAAGVLATIVVVAPQVLTAVADVVPGPVLAWITGAVAFLAAISAAITRVMAIPAVNLWLTKFGLGSVPANTIQ